MATVQVPNPVVLAPFRTFVEVEQPSSEFNFRMQNGPRCALFVADGGAWKLDAMRNIKEYLQAALETESQSGKIVFIIKGAADMQNVIIADDRPAWVVREDRVIVCLTRCSLSKRCSVRLGADCKRLGGLEIPKLS